MKSHDLANEMRKMADYLSSKPNFNAPSTATKYLCFYDKQQFIEAVRALEPGKKEYRDSDLEFNVSAVPIVMSIPRNRVCVLVSPAVYDCEPLLTTEEESSLPSAEDLDAVSRRQEKQQVCPNNDRV